MVSCTLLVIVGQGQVVTGDRSSPLQPLAGDGNSGVSNAVLRDQAEVRVLRVVVAPGGSREMHSHDDVRYHLFTPISASMQLELGDGTSREVTPWHPYFMVAGTQHSFRNEGMEPVEIMEVFVQ
jgi:mannose-6-phosphate isomerase-like protein (cupin superfamily)